MRPLSPTFRGSCRASTAGTAALRPALPPNGDLARVCRSALAQNIASRRRGARFLRSAFSADAGRSRKGRWLPDRLLRARIRRLPQPLPGLPRPPPRPARRSRHRPQGETLPGLDPAFQAGRRNNGGYEPYPDRAAIETGALEPGKADRVSARTRRSLHPSRSGVRRASGSRTDRVMRVAYAGRNGHPYTSIGKLLVQQGALDLETMTLANSWDGCGTIPSRRGS